MAGVSVGCSMVVIVGMSVGGVSEGSSVVVLIAGVSAGAVSVGCSMVLTPAPRVSVGVMVVLFFVLSTRLSRRGFSEGSWLRGLSSRFRDIVFKMVVVVVTVSWSRTWEDRVTNSLNKKRRQHSGIHSAFRITRRYCFFTWTNQEEVVS